MSRLQVLKTLCEAKKLMEYNPVIIYIEYPTTHDKLIFNVAWILENVEWFVDHYIACMGSSAKFRFNYNPSGVTVLELYTSEKLYDKTYKIL